MAGGNLKAEDRTLELAGLRLAVRRLAPESPPPAGAPTLVFLHEALGSIGQWKDFPEALVAATGLPAVVYDRQGHGGSAPLALPRAHGYHATEAGRVLQLMSALSIERAVLVGHSDGGTIALLAAGLMPERVAAVISEAAHVFVEEISRQGIREALEAWRRGELAGLRKYHGEKTDDLVRAWADTWLHPDFAAWSSEDMLDQVTAPVLAIQGVADHYGSPEQVARICAGVAGPCAPLLLPECGHTPHREQRDWVLQASVDFLAEHGLLGRPAAG
jgi:pimeloyl-ACP methyl ester carboxylesterase